MTKSEQEIARCGEFFEAAWNLQFKLKPGCTSAQQKKLLADFSQFAQANSLGLGGEIEDVYVVSLSNRKVVTADEQQLVEQWLLSRSEIERIVGTEPADYWDAWLIVVLVDAQNEAFDAFFS